jgi:hypothetical protein
VQLDECLTQSFRDNSLQLEEAVYCTHGSPVLHEEPHEVSTAVAVELLHQDTDEEPEEEDEAALAPPASSGTSSKRRMFDCGETDPSMGRKPAGGCGYAVTLLAESRLQRLDWRK